MKTKFEKIGSGGKRALVLAAAVLMASQAAWALGSWKTIANFPYSNPGHMMLLTDGTVMVQSSGNVQWYALKPDSQGHYLAGHWSQLTNMIDSRLYYTSQVMQNGKLLVAGGEYGDTASGHAAEVYDPIANTWTQTPAAGVGFSDAGSILLANGDVMSEPVGFYDDTGSYTFLYNPANNTWEPGATDLSYQDEATWLKLPDNSVLSVDVFIGGTTSERYIPNSGVGTWILDANPKQALASANAEIGAAFMLADGTAFWLGGSGHTGIYTPSGNTNLGTWAEGPDMPSYNGQVSAGGSATTNYDGLLSAQDTPAAMMVNGKILCQLAPGTLHAEVWFYEYDPIAKTFNAAPCPTNSTAGKPFYPKAGLSDGTSMLDLPDGTVLYNDTGSLYIYTPDGTTLAAGKPAINSWKWNTDGSLHLTGTLFNGISQGAGYGDDAQEDSNYPLVRFTDGSGNVTYGRTYNWSSTAVQTGSQIVTTECSVPSAIYDNPGSYTMQVVANGYVSAGVGFSGLTWVNFNYTGSTQNGELATPYKTIAGGVSAIGGSGGTIAINASTQPSDTTATLTITNAMSIISVNGPSTIGQ